ncbi:MAG: hypothetical protein V4558_05425 [Gemmatimonadota bacterium]
MTSPASDPFQLVFGILAEERFPAIRAAVPAEVDLDTFLLSGPAVEVLRDLRPDEGLGDGIDEFVAFVHSAYRFWDAGCPLRALNEAETRALCSATSSAVDAAALPLATVAYIQVAPRLIWGQLDDGDVFEPLDGWFVIPVNGGLRIVACFGVHPGRPGLSLLVVEGGAPGPVQREDGSALFAPMMPGGDTAGLFAVVAPEELLLLAWRAAGRAEE